MIKTTKKAAHFLSSESHHLTTLLQKCKELSLLNEKVSVYLDPNIKNYCQVANLVENHLIIIVANGSIATQLRFSIPDLLKRIHQDPSLRKIKYIHCKVQPAFHQFLPEESKNRMTLLSAETAEMMQRIAESLNDPKLKEIMQRIASHYQNKS